MPRSRNVYAYPREFFMLARMMYDNKDNIRVGPMPTKKAKSNRYEWYAFVRAHRTTIEEAQRRLQAALKMKSKPDISIWQTRLAALDVQYETIINYEVNLEVHADLDKDEAHITFRQRSHRMKELAAVLDGQAGTIEDMLVALSSVYSAPAAAPPIQNMDLRQESSTAFLFTMPIEDKITSAIATREEIMAECTTLERSAYVRGLIMQVPDESARDRLLSYLPIIPAEAIAQLDSAPPLGQSSAATPGITLDEFLPNQEEPLK